MFNRFRKINARNAKNLEIILQVLRLIIYEIYSLINSENLIICELLIYVLLNLIYPWYLKKLSLQNKRCKKKLSMNFVYSM